MEETAYIEEVEQEQQPDPIPKKVKVKEFAAKIKAKYPDYKDVDDLELTNKIIAKYPEYKDQVDFTADIEKKNPVGKDLPPTANNTNSVSETLLSEKEPIPIVTDYGNGEVINPKDPFAMAKAANDFSKRTIDAGVTGETSEILPDEKSVKASQEITKDLEKQGFKADFAIAVIDLPEDVFNEVPKEELATLYKENPLKFKQLTNELKNRTAIRQGAYDVANENIPEGKDKEYLARQQAIIESNDYNINEIATPETMDDLRGMMEVKKQNINRNIKDEDTKKKMQARLRDTYASTINADSLNLREEYDNSDVKGIVDINQYAGLETLRIFDPAKYENYKRIIQQKITPLYSVEVNVTPEERQRINTPDSAFAAKNKGTVSPLTISEQIGQETVLRELNAIGLGNAGEQLYSQRSDLIADQNKMIKESERKDITPEELSVLKFQFDESVKRINNIQTKLGDLEKLEKNDDARYPQTAQLKFDAQVKEMVKDDGESVGSFMLNKFGHSMGSSVDAIENLLVSTFGSKDDKAALSMKRIGEQQKFDAKTYLPENERRINSPVIMEFDDGLQKEIKKVLNGRSLGDLSSTERNQLIELVKNNQDKIKTITNPEAGKSKNFLSKATVMTVAGFTSEIAGFMTKMALLRGVGVGSKVAEAEVLFMDGYNRSVQQKLAEGASMDEANSYGILHGAILSTMVKFGSKFEAVKKIMAGGKSPLSKQIAGMSEETWNAIYNKNKSFIERLGKSAKAVAGEQVKMIGTFAGIAPIADAVADNVFYNTNNTVGQVAENVIEGSIDMAIGGLPLIGFGLTKGSMKTKATPLEKAALWNLGDQPTIGKLKIDEAVQKGDLTLEEGELNKKTIDNVSKLISKVPTKTDKGKLMTDEQRVDYLFNLTVQENAKQEAKDLPPKQAEKADYTAKVADYENQIILDTPTTEKLESRKSGIEKKLEQKDEEGKLTLPENERAEMKAELEAVNSELETRKSFEKVEMKRKDIQPKEDVPPPTEQQSGKDVVVDVKQQELDAEKVNKEAGVDIYAARQGVDVNGEKYTLAQIKENGNTNTFLIEDANSNEVGKAQLSADGNYLENIRIDENHRRKGLASKVYDFIELRKGIELEPSPNKQSKEAKALWDNRNLKKSVSNKANGGLLAKALGDAMSKTFADFKNKQQVLLELENKYFEQKGLSKEDFNKLSETEKAEIIKDAIKWKNDNPELVKAVEQSLSTPKAEPLTSNVGGEKAETKTEPVKNEEAKVTEDTNTPTVESKEQPLVIEPTLEGEGGKGKFEEKARKLAEKIMNTNIVPDWLKIDDANVDTKGASAEQVKKALADATIKMGKLLDKGVEFKEAVKEAVNDLVELMGEGMRGKIEDGFAKDYKNDTNYELSGIKKALVSEKVIEGVDLERIGDKEMMALGRKILDTGEVKPEVLVTKIITDGKGVLTPTEVVGLITYKRDIDNTLQDTYKQIAERKANGEDIGTLGVEAKNLERQQNDFDVMAVITAQQQSMAFRLRQRMLDREYNVVTQIEKYKANNNGEIPADVEARFREIDKELKEVKAKLVEAEKKAADKEAQEAVDNIKESVGREKTYTEEELQVELKKERATLRAEKKDKVYKAIDEVMDRWAKKITPDHLKGTNTKGVDAQKVFKSVGAIMKKAYDAGEATAKIVEDAINYISKKIGNKDWGIEEFRKENWEEKLKAGTEKKANDKPTINEDGTVKIPNQMLRDLVKRGVTDINDLTKAVHDQVKKDLPNITERQVRDAITDYGKKVNPTADEIQVQVNTAKRVGRLLSELEDIQKKIKKEKGSNKVKLTDKERELKRQINVLSKDIFGKEEKSDEQRLADAKERTKQRIADLTAKIKKKDFAKPVKKLAVTDTELVKLNAEKEKLQEEYDKEQYKLELKNRSVWQKWEDRAYELTSGVMRGLTLGVDLSAAGVQGMRRLFTNPKRSAIAFADGLKFLVSEKGANEYMEKQKSQPYYPLLRASKLAIDDKAGKQSVKEGMFVSEWINYVWNKGVAPVAGLGTKWGTNFVRKINPYAASQRAYDGYVNSIRIQTYLKLAKELSRDGYTYEADPKVFNKLADFVNTTTGRGSLGAADANSKWLNVFLTAPRKVISEVKLYTPYAFVYYARMPKPVRMKALRDFAQFAGTFMSVNALIWASRKDWGNDEEDAKDNFWNMNSSDFLTHKIGDKRVSIGGGMKSILTMQSRFITGDFTDQYGNTSQLGDRYGKPINTRLDLVTRFAIGKAAPAFNVAAKKMDERAGRPVDDAEIIKNISVPLWLQDVGELYKEDPNSVAPLLTAFSILGANVRVVEIETGITDKDSKEHKFLKENGGGIIPDKKEKLEPVDTNGKPVEVTEEKYKEYTKEVERIAKEEVADVMNNGVVEFNIKGERKPFNKLTSDEKKKWMEKVTNKANEAAMEKMKWQKPIKEDKPEWETAQ